MQPGDWNVPGSTLTQPPFAGPNEPAIVIFPDPIPAAIQAAVTADFGAGALAVAAIIYQVDSTRYEFDVLAVDMAAQDIWTARGAVNTTAGFASIMQNWHLDYGGNITNVTIQPSGLVTIGNPAGQIITEPFPTNRIRLNINNVEWERWEGGVGIQVSSNVPDIRWFGESVVLRTAFVSTLTNVTLGNGSMVHRYTRQGNNLWGRVLLTLGTPGSGGAMGTNPTFTIPASVNTTAYPAFAHCGSGKIVDASTGNGRQVEVRRDAAANQLSVAYWDATPNLAAITAAAPWAWTTGDQIDIDYFVEVT